MYVCSCFGITEEQVKKHADGGACTPARSLPPARPVRTAAVASAGSRRCWAAGTVPAVTSSKAARYRQAPRPHEPVVFGTTADVTLSDAA